MFPTRRVMRVQLGLAESSQRKIGRRETPPRPRSRDGAERESSLPKRSSRCSTLAREWMLRLNPT